MPKLTDMEIVAAARELQAARVASDAAYDASMAAERELTRCQRTYAEAQQVLRRADMELGRLLDRDHRDARAD